MLNFLTTMKINPEYSEQGESRLKVGKQEKRAWNGQNPIREGVLPWQQETSVSTFHVNP